MTREVEWDDDERALRLAYVQYKASLCPSGHYLPDSASPANEDRYVGQARRCHACNAVAWEVERLKDNPRPQALLFGAVLNGGRHA